MKQKVIGYSRVSTLDQNVEKFENDIRVFANSRDFGKVEFVSEKISGRIPWRQRKLGSLIDSLGKGDVLITPEMSRLSRSVRDILEIIEQCKCRGVSVYALKGGWELNGNISSKILLMVLAMIAEVEADLISERTKEGLAARKASGLPLGRPKGPGKSKLDQFRPEIEALLKNGASLRFISKRYNCCAANLSLFCRKYGISTVPKP